MSDFQIVPRELISDYRSVSVEKTTKNDDDDDVDGIDKSKHYGKKTYTHTYATPRSARKCFTKKS